MDITQDIKFTSEYILLALKDFEKRNGYELEIHYEKNILTTKLVKYWSNENNLK